MNDMKPARDDNQLPVCSFESCPAYDGKRCGLMGFRPSHFCEPALIDERHESRRLAFEEAAKHLEADVSGDHFRGECDQHAELKVRRLARELCLKGKT